jgi:RNA-binding protein
MLTSKQRKHLRGLAHELKPLVQVGQRGLTDALARQVDAALTAHELVKVRIGGESPDAGGEVAARLCERLGCDLAGSIGHVLILFRANPEAPRIRLPDPPAQPTSEES